MAANLSQRSFLKELDFTPDEWRHLLTLSRDLKAARRAGTEVPQLKGRQLALIFEKASTRTRCALEVAAREQGADVTYLDPSGSHMGHKESAKDTARVLGRMYDGIGFRGASQQTVEELGAFAGVPVWNGLTDEWHPSQALCDMLTMLEHAPTGTGQIAFAYVGDARFNMGSSLLVAGAMMGMDVRMVSPPELANDAAVIAEAQRLAESTGARLTFTADAAEGVRGADFVHTDVWVSMGEAEEVWQERVDLLKPYRVTGDLLAATGNPGVRFMHCLPAFHNRETTVGERLFSSTGLDGLEVTEEVFESSASIVFDQAENRLHTLKAVLVASLAR